MRVGLHAVRPRSSRASISATQSPPGEQCCWRVERNSQDGRYGISTADRPQELSVARSRKRGRPHAETAESPWTHELPDETSCREDRRREARQRKNDRGTLPPHLSGPGALPARKLCNELDAALMEKDYLIL